MHETVSPTRVFISAAGNIDPERHILAALLDLNAVAPVRAVSTFYRTPALERPDQPEYLNGVVAVETDMAPHPLKYEVLRAIETKHGRVRNEDKYAARTIDLDILLYGDTIVHNEGLVLPDPDLRTRDFLRQAVLELAPDITPPGWDHPLAEIHSGTASELTADDAFTKRVRERLLQ